MLVEDQEDMVAVWRHILIKLFGFLALALMVGILLNLVLALLVLTVQRWRRTRRAEATGAKRTPPRADQ